MAKSLYNMNVYVYVYVYMTSLCRCAVISSISAGASANYTCSLRGRYVNIIPNVTQYLTLCEVEVYTVAGSTFIFNSQLHINLKSKSFIQQLLNINIAYSFFVVPTIKRAFLRIKFNSSEDLSNPTMMDKILQKVSVCKNVHSAVNL